MSSQYAAPIVGWYQRNARDLPWRRPDASPWSILVSEIMLQQTQVARVLPAHAAWLERWPTPSALAEAAPGDAVRQWGRLGYPRRAIRLHAIAKQLTEQHDGRVPSSAKTLAELPGIGSYTAAAVASFAFGQREPVLDTNVRRVLGRLVTGQALPGQATSVAERRMAESLLPPDGRQAARWSVAVMELGALVCSAARPACERCPVAELCRWRLSGSPPSPPHRPGVRYEGTDRHCRGTLLAVLRAAPGAVAAQELAGAWPDPVQRDRSLAGLIADGLVTQLPDGSLTLPTASA
jgi:A/G-specific adenine glycosylase